MAENWVWHIFFQQALKLVPKSYACRLDLQIQTASFRALAAFHNIGWLGEEKEDADNACIFCETLLLIVAFSSYEFQL